ncbi:MAG: indole-3-glycerol-phosphate synthase TrpC, partial [Cellulosilyticum sp.]|nr:indole-3-glycerol-phosphate synthase TrpC [Cellulosilyticum sp.]
MILNQIIADRRKAVEALKAVMTITDLEKQIMESKIRHYAFKEALKDKNKALNIIAEVKKA